MTDAGFTIGVLIAAFCLDLVIGDPRRMPHPVRAIGKGITVLEGLIRRCTKGRISEKAGGVFLAVIIVSSVFLITFAVWRALERSIAAGGIFMVAGVVLSVYLTSTAIAVRDLFDSAKAVIDSVRTGSIDEARRSLSMIVGRDTRQLQDRGILKAAIETLAENLSDGIVAPLFYYAIGGFPLAMAYKAINTLDSMVGYRNEKYINLGWASARLDDIANYLPARITGMLIVAAIATYGLLAGKYSFNKEAGHSLLSAGHAFAIMMRDGRNHPSPNSGIPEAAMAGGLGVMLGGPSTYGGMLVEKPFIGEEVNGDYLFAAECSLAIVLIASCFAAAVSAVIILLRGMIW